MSKQHELILLEQKYKSLAESDPKKFLEIYKSCKLEIDKLLADDEQIK
jgi:hypothetical protein